jgi:hypothetical protein
VKLLGVALLAQAATTSAVHAGTPELRDCGKAKATETLRISLADVLERSTGGREGEPLGEEDGLAIARISAECGTEHKASIALMRPYFEYYIISIGREGLRAKAISRGYDIAVLDGYLASSVTKPDEDPGAVTRGGPELQPVIAKARGGSAQGIPADQTAEAYLIADRMLRYLEPRLP